MFRLRIPLLALSLAAAAAHAQSDNGDWDRVQTLVGPIRGVITTPPKNLITPKFTSGALMGNGDIGVVEGSTEIAEQRFSFGKSDFWGTHWNNGHNAPEVSILSLGSLTLSSPGRTSGGESVYRIEQDILNAQVLSTLKLGNAVVHLRSFTADNDNVFLTEITTDAPDVPLVLSLAMPAPEPNAHMIYPAAIGASSGMLWATRENDLTKPDDYKARAAIAVRLVGTNFTDQRPAPNSAVGTFIVTAGSPVWIVTAFDSEARMNLNGPSSEALRTAVLNHAGHINIARIRSMEAAHREWWRQFWLRSFVD